MNTKMKTYRILSIDAWADCCGCDHTEDSLECCWSWNNWFNVGTTTTIPETLRDLVATLIDSGHISPNILNEPETLQTLEFDDDGYNVVLIEKKTQRPLYAVEYGNSL